MKKILAGLLSLALLLGSVQVYGAEDAILSQPNTENITEQSELSETAENSGETEQEPETPGGESEIPGEEPESPDQEPENPDDNADSGEDIDISGDTEEEPDENPDGDDSQNEEPETPEDTNGEEISSDENKENPSQETTEDIKTTEAESKSADEVDDSADFLENLTVYTSYSGSPDAVTLNPERRTDLDEEFGGKVYTVEYSSYALATAFYVSADLLDTLPDDAKVTLSGWTVDGAQKTTEIARKAFSEGRRYRLNGRVFANGTNGGSRGVYTIIAGNAEHQQTYKIVVLRRLDLSSIGCYLPTDSDLATNIISEKFNSADRTYHASVAADVDSVQINVRPYSINAYYGLTVNGVPLQNRNTIQVPLNEEGDTDITFHMSVEGGYNDPEYQGKTYTTESEYHLIVSKLAGAGAEFKVSPANAVVCVYDEKGMRVSASADNSLLYEGLMIGKTYQWTASCYGYKACQGSFVAGEQSEITADLEEIDSRQPDIEDNDWINYRNSDTNNGVTSAATPSNVDETVQKWAVKMGGDWSAAVTPPLVLGGYLYAASGKFIYKMDRNTGEIVAVSEELAGSMVFALNPLTYAEGMLFAQVGGGQIQAVSATTLKSLWISETVGGQTLSPITYRDGYIYTGTWNSETTAGIYYALSVTDEDPSRGDEIKLCTWKYSHKGGFYWAGAYASGDYLVFGSDDGSDMGNYTNTSILYSVSTKTGQLLDKLTGVNGDIRTTVSFDNGYVYFATKGGYLYRVKMNDDGTFGQVLSYNLGGMATATPLVYKGRIYIGVCGQGGQFNADGGHHFDVIAESDNELKLAYSVSVPGYPQAAPLLSTAYEKEDFNGDGKPDGRVYVYFTANAFPGGIYLLKDEPGQTKGVAEEIFTPDTDQQQYSISTLCVDKDGTIYYKNDSNYMMAIETNVACLRSVEVTSDHGKVTWDRSYRKERSAYELSCEDGTKKATFKFGIPQGAALTVNGKACDGTFSVSFQGDDVPVTAVVSKNGKSTKYTFTVTGDHSSPLLSNLTVSTSNAYTDGGSRIGLEPEFTPEQKEYTTEVYDGNSNRINIFALPEEDSASVTAEGIRGIKKITNYGKTSGSGKAHRIAVYFGDDESEALVKVTVQTRTGKTEVYQVLLRRADVYPPVLSGKKAVRYENNKIRVTFTANEKGSYAYVLGKAGETPSFTGDFTETMAQGENTLDLTVPDKEEKVLYILAKDENGNIMEAPYAISIHVYAGINVAIKVTPSDAEIKVVNQDGQEIAPKNKKYPFIVGNTYQITISRDGYETLNETVAAEKTKTEYRYSLKSTMNSDASLKNLYVSSSDTYGKGIQKLTPAFKKQETKYTAVYGTERQSLNIWAQTANKKASIRVYALAGIRGSTVQKDETISQSTAAGGHAFWKIFFASGEKEAKVRIQVTAEDGTKKNYYVTLKLTDITAPVLKKVSASRLSVDKASVVYKSSEKGYRYYQVVDAGKKIPKLNTKGKGTEIQAGTDTIMLKGLTEGEKDLVIVVKDSTGNVSDQLVIRIPDVKKKGQNPGNANNDGKDNNKNNIAARPGSGGHKSEATTPGKGSDGEGSKANLKLVNGNGSGGDGTKDENGNSSGASDGQKQSGKTKDTSKKTAKAGESEKTKEEESKSGKKDTGDSEKTDKNEKTETTDGEAVETTSSNTDGSPVETVITEAKTIPLHVWILILVAGLGTAYMIFWIRAQHYYRRRMAK